MLDPRAPLIARLRRRITLATGFAIGLATVAAIAQLRAPTPPTPPPTAPPPRAVTITVPPPLVVTIQQTLAAPSASPSPNALGCPMIDHEDRAIGTPIRIENPEELGESVTQVYAAAHAPQLALLHDAKVWISDDDGATFRRAFEGHLVNSLAITGDGTIYAQDGALLGVRAPGGKARWHQVPVATPEYKNQIAVAADEVVWLAVDRVATSRDRGQTWTALEDPDYAWEASAGRTFLWKGSLFQVDHYRDMCGIDDLSVYRLDGAHRVAHDVFHNEYQAGEPVLEASSDVDPTWTWRERCRTDPVGELDRCTKRDATRSQLLQAATLLPAEGARTLAVYEHSVIELCGSGARQIYRTFPFERIDAVDDAGRLLVVRKDTLLRWSPLHGWRRLYALPTPPSGDGE